MQASGYAQKPHAMPPAQVAIDTKVWNSIYPAYISKNKTKALGRRIPLEKAVENPHIMELAQSCKDLGVNFVIEVPSHCKHSFS